MSATVFGYIVLFTLLLAAAASAVEWGLQGRVAARYVWTIAIALAALAPPIVLIWHAAAVEAANRAMSTATGVTDPQSRIDAISDGGSAETMPRVTSHTKVGSIGMMMRGGDAITANSPAALKALSRFNALFNAWFSNMALTVWALLSFALVAWIAAGIFHWRRARRAWTRTTLDGIEVDVSPLTGPAVLGLLSQRIVLPEWATSMQPEHRRLVLAHECEHIRAHDPQRLALAIAAIVVMPWNIALWWCAARLRRAIELDCDARVLRRFPGAKDYGYVLLEVAQRARAAGPLAVPMVALLRLPSELELRLRAMTRPRSAGARIIAAGGILACVAVGAAFSAPVPLLQQGRARAIVRSAAMLVTSPFAGPDAADTVPAKAPVSRLVRNREIDSVNALMRSLQERLINLERARADLQTTRLALQNAEKSFALPDSSRAAIAAAEPAMFGTVRVSDRAMKRNPASQEKMRKWKSKITGIKAQADRAMKALYPNIAAHRDSAAVIWFVADSTGRILKTTYNGGYPRGVLSNDKLSVQFPDVNPRAVESISALGDVLQRSNLYITWVRLTGDPAKFFKTKE